MLHGLWDLPIPKIEPMSPALAGGSLTTTPPGKSLPLILYSISGSQPVVIFPPPSPHASQVTRGNVWRHFWLSHFRGRAATVLEWLETRNYVKHPPMHRTAPYSPELSGLKHQRNPALHFDLMNSVSQTLLLEKNCPFAILQLFPGH